MSRLLSAAGLTKRYGNVTVLRDVDFTVESGEIHALLGANGAGKSTLCKIISGLTGATSGGLRVNDREFVPSNKQDAESRGIQIVQQELNLIPTLSVAENLFLSKMPRRLGIVRSNSLHQMARKALDRLQLHAVDTHTRVENLGVGRRQMVEIAAALASQCEVLILDEPTAALSGTEAELLFEQLGQLREQGVGMIYISHRLDEVKRISDRITVLRDGVKVGTHRTRELSTDQMVQMMSGEQPSQKPESDAPDVRKQGSPKIEAGSPTEPMLVVNKISCGFVKNVSFSVGAGETLGISGLVGSGRTELLRAIFGADVAESGTVSIAGGAAKCFRHPHQAVNHGLAMVTEDRKYNGLLLTQSVRRNTSLAAMGRFSSFGLIRNQKERETSEAICLSMETQYVSVEQLVGQLSGGNQQKVAIAKWLACRADVILFDEPTRGIDVGARRRIYDLFRELSDAGKVIVIASSDLDELFETCDRIAVMSAGRMVDTFARGDWTEEQILEASFA